MRFQGVSLAFVLAAVLLQGCATSTVTDDQLDARALSKSTSNSYNKFIENIEKRAEEARKTAESAPKRVRVNAEKKSSENQPDRP